MEADQVSPQCQCDQTSKTMSTAREIYDYLLALLFHNPPPPPPLLASSDMSRGRKGRDLRHLPVKRRTL